MLGHEQEFLACFSFGSAVPEMSPSHFCGLLSISMYNGCFIQILIKCRIEMYMQIVFAKHYLQWECIKWEWTIPFIWRGGVVLETTNHEYHIPCCGLSKTLITKVQNLDSFLDRKMARGFFSGVAEDIVWSLLTPRLLSFLDNGEPVLMSRLPVALCFIYVSSWIHIFSRWDFLCHTSTHTNFKFPSLQCTASSFLYERQWSRDR